jgi:hypothetical protein
MIFNFVLIALVFVLGIAAAVQRWQIKVLTKDSDYWQNQAAEARHKNDETEQRLVTIAKLCAGGNDETTQAK